MELTQEKVKKLFWYDAESGGLYWRCSLNNYIKPWSKAGKVTGHGYIQVHAHKKVHQAHRIAFLYAHGYLPKQVDHINGVRTDNRLKNLRAATNSQNGMNRGVQANNISGYKGVTFHKKVGNFQARICVGGVIKSLGFFKDAKEAHNAYVKAAGELHGQFARFQ